MTPEIAKLGLQFLARVQLTGQEVPAFNAVFAALSDEAEPKQPEDLPDFTVQQPDE
ncbi:MAG: hypothetical protein V7704_08030 [Aurantimonas endophytica]|uniref:hypothetical protein n=1 Tax=Aurantimonas endophytica TaxID=1522175 RepID=UPI0030024A51